MEPQIRDVVRVGGARPPDGSNAEVARGFAALLDGRRIRDDLSFKPKFPRFRRDRRRLISEALGVVKASASSSPSSRGEPREFLHDRLMTEPLQLRPRRGHSTAIQRLPESSSHTELDSFPKC